MTKTYNVTWNYSSSVLVTIHYVSERGNKPADKVVPRGYTLTASDLPTLSETGYTFNGWDKTVGTVVNDNMTITASWSVIEPEWYTIWEGEENISDKYVNFQKQLTRADNIKLRITLKVYITEDSYSPTRISQKNPDNLLNITPYTIQNITLTYNEFPWNTYQDLLVISKNGKHAKLRCGWEASHLPGLVRLEQDDYYVGIGYTEYVKILKIEQSY